jgi:hypothetical protein
MYDSDQSTVTTALQSSNAAVFSDDTIAKILALTTNSTDTSVKVETVEAILGGTVNTAGSEIVMLGAPVIRDLPVTVTGDAKVIALQGDVGFNLTINSGDATPPPPNETEVHRIVVGSGGADNIVISDARNTQITVGNNDTVVAGGGNDTIVAGLGNSTVVGGTGNAIVQLSGNATSYQVVKTDTGVKVVGNGSTTDISKIQYVALDNGKAMVFAKDTAQAQVTTLYETTFGKTADAATLKSMFDQQAAGKSLQEIAATLTASTEFKQANDSLNNADFVNALYLKTFGRAAEADGLAYWVNALEINGATRAQMVAEFAKIAGYSIDGTAEHVEAQVIGAVTIVHNII